MNRQGIIKTNIDYNNRRVNVIIMRPPRIGGAYKTHRYNNISSGSQSCLLKILQLYGSKYRNGNLETQYNKDIMKLNDYMQWTVNTCASLKTTELDIIHMLFGMSTEIGELTDVFKKDLAYNKEIDWINVGEEVGDLMFYIASFCRIVGMDLEMIKEISTRLAGFENNALLFIMNIALGRLMGVFEDNIFYGKPTNDWIPVTDNIATLIASIISFCKINNLDFDKVIETNVKKLESRYPDKFTAYHAINRDLERERKILANLK